MLDGFLQRLAQFSRFLIPALTCFLFIIASVLVWPLPFVGSVAPSFGLAAVYYWAIYRPDIFRPSLVFVLGLLNDILHFLPFGLSAFVFVGVYQLSYTQRRFFVGQTFYMLWAGFALVSLLTMIVNWCVFSFYNNEAVAFFPVLVQFLLTVVSFPLPAWILIRLQRAFLSQE